jgi:hypothetical protein
MIYTEDTPNELLQEILSYLKEDGEHTSHYTYIIGLVRQQSHLLPTEKQQQFCKKCTRNDIRWDADRKER